MMTYASGNFIQKKETIGSLPGTSLELNALAPGARSVQAQSRDRMPLLRGPTICKVGLQSRVSGEGGSLLCQFLAGKTSSLTCSDIEPYRVWTFLPYNWILVLVQFYAIFYFPADV